MTEPKSAHPVYDRAKGLFWGLSLPLRVVTILFGVVVALLLGYTQFGPAVPEMTYLLGGQEMRPVQLQSACRALDADGLAGYQVDGARIRVPRQQVQQYAAAIAKRGDTASGFYAPFDQAAEQTSWLSSGAQDDRRWELARQKSLTQSIEQMPEVESASVLIDRAASHGLRPSGEVRATVTVKPRAGQELPAFRIRQIRALIVGAVARLAPENVAVVDLNGRTMLELGEDESSSDDLLMRMKAFEEHYAWKIRGVLAFLPDVLVTVNVELETTKQRRTEQVLPAAEETTGSEPGHSEHESRPTVSANSATELAVLEPAAPEPPPLQQTWEEHVALAPKSLTVSVSVPRDVAATLAGNRASDQESTGWTEPVRQRVASAIPAGIQTSISISSHPRGVDLGSIASQDTGKPAGGYWWGATTIACAAVIGYLVWLGVRWHQRQRLGGANSLSGSRPRESASGRSAARSREARRELVRVERDAARDGRGPHIMQARIAGFEDLRRLAPSSLQAVLGAVDSRLWAPALRGASRQLCDRILTHMPARAATLLRDEIEFPGPVRLGDVETAQQEVLEIVRRLDHTGDLMIEDREEILHE